MDKNKDRTLSLGEFREWLEDPDQFKLFKAPAEAEQDRE